MIAPPSNSRMYAWTLRKQAGAAAGSGCAAMGAWLLWLAGVQVCMGISRDRFAALAANRSLLKK